MTCKRDGEESSFWNGNTTSPAVHLLPTRVAHPPLTNERNSRCHSIHPSSFKPLLHTHLSHKCWQLPKQPVNSLYQNSFLALHCEAAPWSHFLHSACGSCHWQNLERLCSFFSQARHHSQTALKCTTTRQWALSKHKQFNLPICCSLMGPARSSSLWATRWCEDMATLGVKPLLTSYSFEMPAPSCLPTWISVSAACITHQIQSKLPEGITHWGLL